MPPPVVYISQAQFLALLDRLLPFEYLAPLKSPGPGYEIYQSAAAVGARASQAIGNFEAASFILSAPDAALAAAPVTFLRPGASAGAVTIKAGTVVSTSKYGRQFVLAGDVQLAASGVGSLAAGGTAVALYPGEQWNVAGPYTTARGERVAGAIDTIDTWVQDPPFADATVTVAQAAGATGGMSPVLNQHGADRGFARGAGEPADAFRFRIRNLPNTVSPAAIRDLMTAYQTTYPGTTWGFIETFDPAYQEAFDCPSPNVGTPTYQAAIPTAAIDTNLFTYDDPAPAFPPFRNRWLDPLDYRGAFIVVVPNLAAVADFGMAYDDTAVAPSGFVTVNGLRSVSAYDIPSAGLIVTETAGAYDAGDLQKAAVYAQLYDTLQRAKAGGVFVVLEMQGE